MKKESSFTSRTKRLSHLCLDVNHQVVCDQLTEAAVRNYVLHSLPPLRGLYLFPNTLSPDVKIYFSKPFWSGSTVPLLLGFGLPPRPPSPIGLLLRRPISLVAHTSGTYPLLDLDNLFVVPADTPTPARPLTPPCLPHSLHYPVCLTHPETTRNHPETP